MQPSHSRKRQQIGLGGLVQRGLRGRHGLGCAAQRQFVAGLEGQQQAVEKPAVLGLRLARQVEGLERRGAARRGLEATFERLQQLHGLVVIALPDQTPALAECVQRRCAGEPVAGGPQALGRRRAAAPLRAARLALAVVPAQRHASRPRAAARPLARQALSR
jgi:hypothetical protein